MQFTIFANGKINSNSIKLSKSTKIIAVDGGAQHCIGIGIIPDVLIGDFDSVTPDTLDVLKSGDVEIIRHPEDKNETDLELAISYAVRMGAAKITLFGLLGGRWDMSFANILLLASPHYSRVEFHVIGDHLEIFILRGGESVTLGGKLSDLVSVLSLRGNALGVTYKGLLWALDNAELPFGSPLGISNQMVKDEATISLKTGTLLIFHSSQ